MHATSVDLLGDHKYIGPTGQAQGGLFIPDGITSMKLGSKALHAFCRYSRSSYHLKFENSIGDREVRSSLVQRIDQDSPLLMDNYISWKNWRTIRDDADWVEHILENTLQDWNTGNTNIQRILPYPKY